MHPATDPRVWLPTAVEKAYRCDQRGPTPRKPPRKGVDERDVASNGANDDVVDVIECIRPIATREASDVSDERERARPARDAHAPARLPRTPRPPVTATEATPWIEWIDRLENTRETDAERRFVLRAVSDARRIPRGRVSSRTTTAFERTTRGDDRRNRTPSAIRGTRLFRSSFTFARRVARVVCTRGDSRVGESPTRTASAAEAFCFASSSVDLACAPGRSSISPGAAPPRAPRRRVDPRLRRTMVGRTMVTRTRGATAAPRRTPRRVDDRALRRLAETPRTPIACNAFNPSRRSGRASRRPLRSDARASPANLSVSHPRAR